MNRFSAIRLAVDWIVRIETDLEVGRRARPSDDPTDYTHVQSSDIADVKELLNYLETTLGFMEWRSVSDRILILRNKLKPGIELSELHIEIAGLAATIGQELKRRWFIYLPTDKALKQRNAESEWASVISAFPSTQKEIAAAHSCYATQNDTAAVFHMMRVAEIGLRALAKERKIALKKGKPVEWGTWQDIINALDAEAEAIGATRKAGPAKDRALAFYRGALHDLNGFKDEYRNLVMHVREMYDQYQSLRAITNVHAFMTRVSAKIDSRHHRIRWGFKK